MYRYSIEKYLFYIGQPNRSLKFCFNGQKLYIQQQENNKSIIVKHDWEKNNIFYFNSAEIFG